MFNLLPKTLRDVVKREYNFRKVVLSLLFVVFIQIAFLVFMFPTWLVSNVKEKEVAIRGAAMNEYLSNLNIASTTSSIKSINAKLAIMDRALEYPQIVPFINNILSKKSGSIKITDIIYTVNDTKNAVMTIEGVSATRESLTTFVKSLDTLGLFKNIDLPISNYTKDKDLSFSINLTIQRP